jgi:hypothetical protein
VYLHLTLTFTAVRVYYYFNSVNLSTTNQQPSFLTMFQATSFLFLVIAAFSVNAGPLEYQAAADHASAAIAAPGMNIPPVINQAAPIAVARAADDDATKLAGASVAVTPPIPHGAQNVGKGKGNQFIGGPCLSRADCSTNCCVASRTSSTIGTCIPVKAVGQPACNFRVTSTN